RVNLKASAFDSGFCSEVGHILERFDEFRPAIWVATVIDCVYAEKNVTGGNHFRPCECVREEDSVARGDVGDWNATPDFYVRTLLWHIEIVGERRAAEDAQVDLCNTMLFCA